MILRKLLLIAILVFFAALPALGLVSGYWLHILNVTWIAAIAALGVTVATGMTGLIVLGQAAVMGLGAYTTALAMMLLAWPWWVALSAALLLAAAVGVMLGLLSLRIKGHYLAIMTLALNEIFRLVALNESELTGGPMGLRNIPGLDWTVLGPNADHQLYLPIFLSMVVVYAIIVRLYGRQMGRQMRAVRDDDLAAESMGVNTRVVQIRAFVLCSVFGALAGGLYALMNGFISPNNFLIMESIKIVLMTVLGGMGSIGGALLGAAVITILPEALRDLKLFYMAGFGLGVVVILLVAPRGLGVMADWFLAPWLPKVEHERSPGGIQSINREAPDANPVKPVPSPGESFPQESAGVLMAFRGISKHFGGIYALRDVSFEVREGEILGLIGPNGSGKSTLVNIGSGVINPDDGAVLLGGTDVTRMSPWEIHGRGVSRIFQNVRLWESMTVLENVMLAWAGKSGGFERDARDAAMQALEDMGIAYLANCPSGDLSFGQSRLVELARAMVTRPKLLLLDEPAAGLRGGLVIELAETLERLRARGTTILVIEHRTKLVMSMCDRVIVLNLGEVISEGVPQKIQTDPHVVEAYLGERAAYDLEASPA